MFQANGFDKFAPSFRVPLKGEEHGDVPGLVAIVWRIRVRGEGRNIGGRAFPYIGKIISAGNVPQKGDIYFLSLTGPLPPVQGCSDPLDGVNACTNGSLVGPLSDRRLAQDT